MDLWIFISLVIGFFHTVSHTQATIHGEGGFADSPDVDECYIYVNSDGATISSPNFWHKYDINTRCTYQIETYEGHLVTLHFSVFDLEDSHSCEYDSLKIYDGRSTDSTLLGTYCGTFTPPPVQSTGSWLTMRFISDYSETRSGFRATVQITKDTCASHINTNNAIITSLNYPGYDNNLICTYHVEAPDGHLITVQFTDFAISWDSTCDKDYVEIYDGSNQNYNVLGKYCGYRVPDGVTSSGNLLLIKFKSNGSNTARGFQAVVVWHKGTSAEEDVTSAMNFVTSFQNVVTEEIQDAVFQTDTAPQHIISMTQCDVGWTTYYNDSFYCFVDLKRKWPAASWTCAGYGGHLLQVDSSNENDFIRTSMENNYAEFIWLGITDNYEEGVWKTDDNLTPSNYTNWDSGEPNNLYNEDCVAMPLSYGNRNNLRLGAWYDIACRREFPFVCEK